MQRTCKLYVGYALIYEVQATHEVEINRTELMSRTISLRKFEEYIQTIKCFDYVRKPFAHFRLEKKKILLRI